MTRVLSLRVPDELAEWAESFAAQRGVTRQALLEEGLRSFRRDCERGVPEFRELARRQAVASAREAALGVSQGVGDCLDRPGELGHVWRSVAEDERRSCRFCGAPGRGKAPVGRGGEPEGPEGFFERATRERTELFARLKTPESIKSGVKRGDRD